MCFKFSSRLSDLRLIGTAVIAWISTAILTLPADAQEHDRSRVSVTPDDLKFRSCMTLFSLAADDPHNPFREALDRWCGGQPDEQTLARIEAGR